MRFEFRQLPGPVAGKTTPRPVVDVWLEGIEQTPLGCLVDSGALHTRFARELAEIAGIDLAGAPRERFAIGGTIVEGTAARVSLRLGSGENEIVWDAPVWFCEPWPFAFQLLGLDGFLRHFLVTLSAYHEWIECVPES